MTTQRREIFVYGQVTWMLVALVGLAALEALTLKQFFIVSLVGFLVLTEVTAPFNVTPRWRVRLRWLVVLGLLGFGYTMVMRIIEFLPWGLL